MTTLVHICKSGANKGQEAKAEIITVSPSEPRNIGLGAMVYRASTFKVAGDSNGWDLLPREYRTMEALIAAAKRKGMTVI